MTATAARRRSRAAPLCGLASAAFALATPLLAARARPGYDACSQFISELGERGAPHATLVALAGFLPTGLLALAFALGSAAEAPRGSRARRGFLLFGGVGLAYVGSVFFPCDPGCPAASSARQLIHTGFGAVEYVGGGAGLLLVGCAECGSRGARRLGLVGGPLVLLVAAGLLAPPLAPVRGLLQRVAEVALFLWMTWVSAARLAGGAGGSRPPAP